MSQPQIHDIRNDGCLYHVGCWLDPTKKRMAVQVDVLDDPALAQDIRHLMDWRIAHQGQPLAEALPL